MQTKILRLPRKIRVILYYLSLIIFSPLMLLNEIWNKRGEICITLLCISFALLVFMLFGIVGSMDLALLPK